MCSFLVDAVNECGGVDNSTVLIVDVIRVLDVGG